VYIGLVPFGQSKQVMFKGKWRLTPNGNADQDKVCGLPLTVNNQSGIILIQREINTQTNEKRITCDGDKPYYTDQGVRLYAIPQFGPITQCSPPVTANVY
jgi:hypothetical protein